MTRTAVVRNADLETVKAYLPSNYEAYQGTDNGGAGYVLIVGSDDHGWTMDGYVIPRLASGLIVAEEQS
jgi:hypothetical protein